MSVPTAVLATMSAGARRALLIKEGRALEQLARMDTLVFDKMGMLTAGTPQVVDVRALAPEVGADGVLALAAAVEQRLSHPAAQAIVRAEEERGVAIPERGDSHFTVGMGVEADVQGYRVLLGSPRYLARRRVAVSLAAAAIAEQAG